jgi:hypothetical protein
MVETEQTAKRSIGCATEEAMGGVSGVVNATLELFGDLAHRTAKATVPCDGTFEEAKPGTTPVNAIMYYTVEALNNMFRIVSDGIRDTATDIRDTDPVSPRPTTTTGPHKHGV